MSIYLLVYKHINSLAIFNSEVSDRKRVRTQISTWLFQTLTCSKFLSLNNTISISEVGNWNRAGFSFHLLLYLLPLLLNSSQHSSLICSAFHYPYCTQSHLCSRKTLNTQFREEEIYDIQYCLRFRKQFCMHTVLTIN